MCIITLSTWCIAAFPVTPKPWGKKLIKGNRTCLEEGYTGTLRVQTHFFLLLRGYPFTSFHLYNIPVTSPALQHAPPADRATVVVTEDSRTRPPPRAAGPAGESSKKGGGGIVGRICTTICPLRRRRRRAATTSVAAPASTSGAFVFLATTLGCSGAWA